MWPYSSWHRRREARCEWLRSRMILSSWSEVYGVERQYFFRKLLIMQGWDGVSDKTICFDWKDNICKILQVQWFKKQLMHDFWTGYTGLQKWTGRSFLAIIVFKNEWIILFSIEDIDIILIFARLSSSENSRKIREFFDLLPWRN